MHGPRSADAVLRNPLSMRFNERALMHVPGYDCVGVDFCEVLSELPSPASRATAAAESMVIPEAVQCCLFAALCSE